MLTHPSFSLLFMLQDFYLINYSFLHSLFIVFVNLVLVKLLFEKYKLLLALLQDFLHTPVYFSFLGPIILLGSLLWKDHISIQITL